MSFKQRLLSALGWSVGIKLSFQMITWAMTLLVIRVLAPSDYGLMAITQVFTNFMLGFANLGLGDALVQRADVPRHTVASVFGMLLAISTLLTVSLCLTAWPIARWYGDARLAPLLQVASLGFIFNGLTTVPRMYLTKSLRVRPMFIMELSSGTIGAVTVAGLAFTGHGVWSLMLGGLTGNIAKLIGFAVLTAEYNVRPAWDLAAVRPLLGFGAYRTLDYLAFFVLGSADVLIVGRVLGASSLGLYTVVMNFACVPLTKVAPIVNSIAFPAFAMVQDQPAHARFYALKGLRLTAALAVPVFFGVAATAPEIVDVVFGAKWHAARPLLAILSLAITFRALLLVLPNYLQGMGEARAAFWCTAVSSLIIPPAVLLGTRWGITGACAAWLICYPFVYVLNGVIAAQRGNLPLGTVIGAPVRPFLAAVVMVIAVTELRPLLPTQLPELGRLLCLVAAGALVYGTVMALAFRDLMAELVRLVRRQAPSVA
jgi:O-antigen/teichoic acid export membrane protein